jgi:GntR family transcriptional regulator / MocR family aminotransferase
LGDRVDFKILEGGLAVWVKFLHDDLTELAQHAAKQGVFMMDGNLYNTPDQDHRSTRLGFSALNEVEMAQAAKNKKGETAETKTFIAQ